MAVSLHPSRGFSARRLFSLIAIAALPTACIPNAAGDNYGVSGSSANTPQLETDMEAIRGASPPPPVWEARPVSRNAVSVTGGSYVVQSGDTLRAIGNKTGAGSEALAMANGLEAPFTIYPGQRLTVPSGLFHVVSSGETGIAIARAYGVRWSEIVARNNLEEPFILRIGQRLQLPGGAVVTAPVDQPQQSDALEQRAAAFSLDIDDIVTGGQPATGQNTTIATAAPSAPKPVIAPKNFNGQFRWPANGKVISRFGDQGGGKVNDGIAIAMTQGAPFRAAATGVVAYTGDDVPTLGNLILVDHGSGWVTAYGNASQISVQRGDTVQLGQVLGRAGQTGLATRPQLHFELRRDRKPVDPLGKLGAQ
ncbi:LysM peptidoglycan-binding domain-containing M23 family metallopeptidase [Alterisphingorhabdus coralli]|uniref:LysM peptidoglycan-binding domain-containing M23 family metallopeptidase n=1 Tax=Alterisphingorhabdus coralli TaxID=3071408 RepID=A0AA97F6Y2_9SPHN|nr:LysM peptidoglycan-binding domain-containing M23 family metallopeptidase [Parasphingorhabdus sp. SCSIO 66989]WOE74393.1 LysM peptidoglycan-binding domain-containing M23 family metallopeptidase [Parasphingorhabdus sp. SCSIO 66989]